MSNPPQESEVPLVKRVPAPSVASPAELRLRNEGDVRWYKPSFSEVAQLLGWRWIYFVPAFFVLLLPLLAIWRLPFIVVLLGLWKIGLILVVLPTTYAINLARHILRDRKEPFCIHCGYNLTSLPDNHTCPECGEPFNFRLIEEYKRDPNWFIRRYQMHQELPLRDVPFNAGPVRRGKSRDGT